jgi:mono/diheme cytochrome c family protein
MLNKIKYLKNMHTRSKPRKYLLRLSSVLILLAVMAASCDRSREDRGYEYFPDMAYSYAYETYTEDRALKDDFAMMEPVEGTIPRDMIPFKNIEIDRGAERPGIELTSPLAIDQKVLEEGRNLYAIFCLSCHGEKGDGQGHLFTSGKYPIPPRSLIDPTVVKQSAGQIYYTISAGYGVMGQHASLIRPDDRWKIVAYIEKMIQKK